MPAQDEELRQREQELIAEEQRRLEEGALMASQNFITSPQADAEAAALQAQFNQQAQPTAFAPAVRESYTPDSAQYQQEVARAQRGSGFINADIGPGGNVITGAYDPSIDPQRIIAEREATNLQRQQLYGQLLRDGATAAEAFRFANSRFPDIKSASAMIRAESLENNQKPMQPEILTLDGVRMMRTGLASFARIPEPRLAATESAVPPDVAISQKLIAGQIAETRNDLQRAKAAYEKEPEDIDAVRRARVYQEQLRGLEQQLQQGSTNWMGATSLPSAAQSPFTDGTIVRNKQTGKRYRIVKGEPVEL